MKKLALVTAGLALLTLAASGAWANAVPIQVTLSNTSLNSVAFLDTGASISFWFTGTSSQCGHANCLSGTALLEPKILLGTYWMWITGGTPSMTGGSGGNFAVNMNGATIHFALQLTGHPDTLTTDLTLAQVAGGLTSTPIFDGTFANATSTGLFMTSAFPPGADGTVDFTIRMGSPTLTTLVKGQSDDGNISSGELVPSIPEPSTVALLGTGVLGLAGAIRRKMNR